MCAKGGKVLWAPTCFLRGRTQATFQASAAQRVDKFRGCSSFSSVLARVEKFFGPHVFPPWAKHRLRFRQAKLHKGWKRLEAVSAVSLQCLQRVGKFFGPHVFPPWARHRLRVVKVSQTGKVLLRVPSCCVALTSERLSKESSLYRNEAPEFCQVSAWGPAQWCKGLTG